MTSSTGGGYLVILVAHVGHPSANSVHLPCECVLHDDIRDIGRVGEDWCITNVLASTEYLVATTVT